MLKAALQRRAVFCRILLSSWQPIKLRLAACFRREASPVKGWASLEWAPLANQPSPHGSASWKALQKKMLKAALQRRAVFCRILLSSWQPIKLRLAACFRREASPVKGWASLEWAPLANQPSPHGSASWKALQKKMLKPPCNAGRSDCR